MKSVKEFLVQCKPKIIKRKKEGEGLEAERSFENFSNDEKAMSCETINIVLD